MGKTTMGHPNCDKVTQKDCPRQTWCQGDENCTSGNCDKPWNNGLPNNTGVCRMANNRHGRDGGLFCNNNDQCKSHNCDGWLCTQPMKARPAKSSVHKQQHKQEHKQKSIGCLWADKSKCENPRWSCKDDHDCADVTWKGKAYASYCDVKWGQRNVCRWNRGITGRPDGLFCTSDAQCNSGACNGWSCAKSRSICTDASRKKCQGEEYKCEKGQCPGKSFCDIVPGQSPNVCRKWADESGRVKDEYCTKNSQCRSGYCHGFKCQDAREVCKSADKSRCPGDAYHCDSNADCPSGTTCDIKAGQKNVCRVIASTTDRAKGDYCTKNGQCGSGYCHDFECQDAREVCKSTDKSRCSGDAYHCDSNADCPSGTTCDIKTGQKNVCRVSDDTTDRAKGDYCTKNSQCGSGYCHGFECQDAREVCKSTDKSQCQGDAYHCDSNADCPDSGICDIKAGQSNVCRVSNSLTNRTNGDYCNDDGQCSGGYCNGYACSDQAPDCSFTRLDVCWKKFSHYVVGILVVILAVILAPPLLQIVTTLITTLSRVVHSFRA
jgi:hypothetical protein